MNDTGIWLLVFIVLTVGPVVAEQVSVLVSLLATETRKLCELRFSEVNFRRFLRDFPCGCDAPLVES